MALNPKQQRFVEEYIRCGNATEAYTIAYECDNYETANANGPRLLVNASVKEAVSAAQRCALQSTGLTAQRWAEEVALLAFSDHTHYSADADGRLLTTGPPGSQRAVSSVKVKVKRRTTGRASNRHTETDTETEIKLWSKPDSLRMAGQALGILKGTLELSGSVGRTPLDNLPDDDLNAIEAILERAADPGASAGGEGEAPPS